MRSRHFIVASIVCLFGLQCISIVHYLNEENYLSNLMDTIAPRSLPPSVQAMKVVESLRTLPVIENTSYFLFPVFSVLRPMPQQILEQGGDCGDRSRLVIRMLHLRGIQASKWAIYTKEMKSVHAVVELESETGKMVADPLFGLWFPRSDRGYYGIRELRQSPNILSDRIQSLVAQGKRPGASDLRKYPLDDYSYEYARTINWEKWIGMWALYKMLRVIMGAGIDDLQRPTFVETPQLMVVMIAGAIQGGLIIAYFALVRLDGNMKRERFPSHRKPSDIAL